MGKAPDIHTFSCYFFQALYSQSGLLCLLNHDSSFSKSHMPISIWIRESTHTIQTLCLAYLDELQREVLKATDNLTRSFFSAPLICHAFRKGSGQQG